MGRPGFILDELKDYAWFPHTCITNDDEFKEIIVIVHKYYIIRFPIFYSSALYYTTIPVI